MPTCRTGVSFSFWPNLDVAVASASLLRHRESAAVLSGSRSLCLMPSPREAGLRMADGGGEDRLEAISHREVGALEVEGSPGGPAAARGGVNGRIGGGGLANP